MFKEKCGIIGATGTNFDAARLIHPGLSALQHRGQESSGIATADGRVIRIHKGMGLVAHVYGQDDLDALTGHIAIGHNRYSTSQGSSIEHAQPVLRRDRSIALAHNGNLPSTKALEDFLTEVGVSRNGSNDSEMMVDAIRYHMHSGATVEEAIIDAYPLFTGAFSLLVATNNKMIAVRDPKGIRPLTIGQLNGGYLVASETCALDTLGAHSLTDVLPGQMVVFSENGIQSYQIVNGQQKLDIFEFVYFARPDSMLLGQRVNEVRRRLGIYLADEAPVQADVVIPVPESAIPSALGYAYRLGIPYDTGLIKNRYIHRTFITPEQHIRDRSVALKLRPIPEIVSGKRVVIIDDSIVRGTTSRKIIELVRQAGAREVHLRIPAPPVLYPDFYGIDTPNQSKLIATHKSLDEIRNLIGADSLEYLSYESLIKATNLPEDLFCTSCFTGVYPLDIAERQQEVTHVIFKR